MRVLLYSAVYGGYDELHPWVEQDTEHEVITVRLAEVSPAPAALEPQVWAACNPRLRARYWKCLPPWTFAGDELADVAIWVDGSIEITSPKMVDGMLAALGDAELALFRHAGRSTIAEELAVAAPMGKYIGAPMAEAVEWFREHMGYDPSTPGLFELGGNVRWRSPAMQRLGELWWDHTYRWSNQRCTMLDQLTLPPLLAHLEISPAILPGSVWNGGDDVWWTLYHHPEDH